MGLNQDIGNRGWWTFLMRQKMMKTMIKKEIKNSSLNLTKSERCCLSSHLSALSGHTCTQDYWRRFELMTKCRKKKKNTWRSCSWLWARSTLNLKFMSLLSAISGRLSPIAALPPGLQNSVALSNHFLICLQLLVNISSSCALLKTYYPVVYNFGKLTLDNKCVVPAVLCYLTATQHNGYINFVIG